jgi:uncharacterized protein (UPF0548 family)
MFVFRKPRDNQIRNYLAGVVGTPLTYPLEGCTELAKASIARGWNVDHERVLIGRGQDAFESAKQAIREWRMFPPEVATLCWPDCPIESGRLVAVLYRAQPALCWMLFPARIVYTIDEQVSDVAQGVDRFGFAYGTVADHPESGEERFLVEWDRATDEVWYDLLAISKPAHWLARLGYPYTRYEQARFRRLSCQAMVQAVSPSNRSVVAEVSESVR